MTQQNSFDIKKRHEISWASGSLVTGAVANAMSLFALFFLTSQMGIEAGLAGVLIFSTKLYDAISDPVMGRITDCWVSPKGRRSPFLILGAVITGLSFLVFFNLPALSAPFAIPVVLVMLILISTGYTIFAVPYLAMPPDIASNYDGRTRLMGYRVFFLMIGVLIGAVLGPALVGDGFGLMGAVIGAIVILAGLNTFVGVRHLDAATVYIAPEKRSFFVNARQSLVEFKDVFETAPFRLLTLVKFLQFVVLATVLASVPYFFSNVLKLEPMSIAIYMGVFSLSGIVSIPLLRVFIKRMDKKNSYIIMLIIYAVGTASWFLWAVGEAQIWFYLRAVCIGVASTGTMFCALSLLPDTMEYDKLVSGKSREGAMSGVFTLVEKLSGAFGPLIVGLMLQMTGLIVTKDTSVVQPETALTAIRWSVSLIPACIALLCVPVLLKYDLDESKLLLARQNS